MSFEGRSVRLVWEATVNRKLTFAWRLFGGILLFIWGLGVRYIAQKFPHHIHLLGSFYTLLTGTAFYALRFMFFSLRLNQLQEEEERRILGNTLAELPSEEDLKYLKDLNRNKET